jgi:hypothetical protein
MSPVVGLTEVSPTVRTSLFTFELLVRLLLRPVLTVEALLSTFLADDMLVVVADEERVRVLDAVVVLTLLTADLITRNLPSQDIPSLGTGPADAVATIMWGAV